MHNCKLPTCCVGHVKDASMKKSIMRECDKAFELPIVERDEFSTMFQKIQAGADFFVAYNKNILGYVAIYANDSVSREAYITAIAVKPEYQQMHIGTTLISVAEYCGRSKGMEHIRLEVLENNLTAIHFYQNRGFNQCSSINIRGKDRRISSFYMRKDL